MKKERLEAYTDAILAIIITIMVLEMKAPENLFNWEALKPTLLIIAIYIFSFINIVIYWINHYHLFYYVEKVENSILWLNNINLFFITLLPFVTSWMGNNLIHSPISTAPSILYSGTILMINVTYYILINSLEKKQNIHLSEFKSQKKSCIQSVILLIIGLIGGIWNALFTMILTTLSVITFWVRCFKLSPLK